MLDNKPLLLEDPRIRLATSHNVHLILSRSYWWPYADSNLYRPVTTLSYLVNYAVLGSGERPAGYHAVNLLLHTVNVLLVYALSLRLSRRLWPSFFVAAVWAVQPLSTEAVTNIAGRADLLAAFGVLGGLFAYIRAGDTRGRASTWWIVGAVSAGALGMFSKESGVALVGMVVLYDLLFRRREQPLRTVVWKWIVIAVPLFVLLYVRSIVVPPSLAPDPFVDNPIAGAPFWTGRLTALSVIGRSLWLTIWPLTLSTDYSYAQIPLARGSATEWVAWISVALVVTVTIVLLGRSLATRAGNGGDGPPAWERLSAFALAFALIALFPASNIVVTTGTIMAERLMYLPSAGVAACVVMALFGLAGVVRVPAAAPAALCLILAAFGARTWTRNMDWRDEVTLWTSAARVAPRSFKTHQGLADALYESDPSHRDLSRVIEEAERSVAILETLPDAVNVPGSYRRAAGYHLEHGDLLRDSGTRGAASESKAAYERSVVLTRRHLAIVAATPTKKDGAWELSEAYVMLSTGYARLQDSDKAIEAARQAQVLQPLNSIPYRVIAAALIDGMRYDEAAVWLLAGFMVSGDPELSQATIDLYRAGGDPKGCALKKGDEGFVLDPSCETVRRHLCAATVQAVQIQRAIGRGELARQLEETARQNYGCR